METKTLAITRTHVIVVNEVGQNAYNDLTFTDKEGGQYKVSAKRRQYFDNVIVAGAAVQLSYAEAYGKEYIYSATQVKDNLPPPQQPKPPIATEHTPPKDTLAVAAKTMGATLTPEEIKLRSMSISYSKDAWCAGKIEAKDITAYADRFLKYMKGG